MKITNGDFTGNITVTFRGRRIMNVRGIKHRVLIKITYYKKNTEILQINLFINVELKIE